jgi:hypothetical protein
MLAFRMLRTRFRPKREVTRRPRKLHNDAIYKVYAKKYNRNFKSKRRSECVHLVGMWEMRNTYIKILIGNHEENSLKTSRQMGMI